MGEWSSLSTSSSVFGIVTIFTIRFIFRRILDLHKNQEDNKENLYMPHPIPVFLIIIGFTLVCYICYN